LIKEEKMNLVVVESPAKAKTIEKYLGPGYKVLATFGHVRDLPEKKLGIDVAKNFEPDYQALPRAKKIIAEIKSAEKKADQLYLATDLDREGEAISWHLLHALKIPENSPKVKRIVFNEITKSAIGEAIKNPRGLDINLVNAQQARRILDRLVGYKLSPFLWKKVKSGLSAGRVQSVAVRLVVEKEKEINSFVPEEYWQIFVELAKQGQKLIFPAYLSMVDGKSIKKLDIKTEDEAAKITKGLAESAYKVVSVENKESLRRPSPPFTTSTLQMEASRKLGYSPKRTMILAQKLYEAGHISYMRTDSTNLSKEAVAHIRDIIGKDYGKDYLPENALAYKTKSAHAQEAHEAIRPSHFEAKAVSSDHSEQRLYDLIWKRTIASQMREAIINITTALIETVVSEKHIIFSASGESVVFEGFIKVYTEGRDEVSEEKKIKLPKLEKDELLDFHKLVKNQNFTEPPKRYTEAMLVKKLEALGIGRPSTYAPTLDTIKQRGYVDLVEKRFIPTEIGVIVSDLLVKHFTDIVDYKFTAGMEAEFDEIAEGKLEWQKAIAEFYKPFENNLLLKQKEVEKDDIVKLEKLEENCPVCGEGLIVRLGRFGKFIACSKYPECKYSRPLEDVNKDNLSMVNEKGDVEKVTAEMKCEKCGGKMVVKEGRFGRFLACENYPKCKNTKALVANTNIKCPECKEGDVIERRTKKGKKFWGCSRYPKCKHASWEDPSKSPKTDKRADS